MCFLQYLQQTQKNPLVPQRIVSADTKTCQHTSRFILPYCDVAEVFVSREGLFPLTALAALVTFFHFRFMRQGHGLRRNFMLVLIIIRRWILSPTVPILHTEKQFYEILSVNILPKEPQGRGCWYLDCESRTLRSWNAFWVTLMWKLAVISFLAWSTLYCI